MPEIPPLFPEDALDGFIIRRCQKCGREHAPVRPCETASNPHPMVQIVCQACGEPWEVHKALSKYYDPDEDTWISDEITLLTCIAALKKRNQGPEGPVGPIGATGEPGPVANPMP